MRGPVELATAPAHQIEHRCRYKPERDPLRDARRERHHDYRQEGRDRLVRLAPCDVADGRHHENTDENQRGCKRRVESDTVPHIEASAHDAQQRVEEHRDREKKSGRHRSESRAAAGMDASGAFDVARHGGSADQPADDGAGRVRKESFTRSRKLPVYAQPGALAHADECAHGVEQVDEEDDENDREDIPLLEKTLEVRCEESSRERIRKSENPLKLGESGEHGQDRRRQYTHDDRCVDAKHRQDRGHGETEKGKKRRRAAEIAEPDIDPRRRGYDPAPPQPDHRYQETDPHRHALFQVVRNALDEPCSEFPDGGEHKKTASEDDRREGLFPPIAVPPRCHRPTYGESEKEVLAHPGGKSDRIVGVDGHPKRRKSRSKASRRENGPLVHARDAQNGRVDEQDVAHGHVGGETGQKLGAHRASALTNLEGPLRPRD